MKKNKIKFLLIFISFSLFLLTCSKTTVAQEKNSQTTASGELKIQELKEKLASRVAELNTVSQRLIKGEIKTLSDEKIVLMQNGSEININISEESSFYKLETNGAKKTVKIADLKTGQTVYSPGSYNTATNSLITKTINVVEFPTIIAGVVKNVDKKNYQLMVSAKDKEYLIDHDVATKNFLLDPEGKMQRSGFSKYAEGQTVFVLGDMVTDKSGKDLLSAFRIIILKNPLVQPSPTPTPTKSK